MCILDRREGNLAAGELPRSLMLCLAFSFSFIYKYTSGANSILL